jgi:hypothetical protein
VTEHPGEQFPPDVDPDVEPGFEPYPSEETPHHPDYDTEPAPQNFTDEETPESQSYDVEPARESYDEETPGGSFGAGSYGGSSYDNRPPSDAQPAEEPSGENTAEPELDTEAAFETSLEEQPAPAEEPAPAEHAEAAERAEAVEHVDPAEVEFGPEFARAPGEEHDHPFAAEAAVPEHEEAGPQDQQAEDDPPGRDEEAGHPLVEETMGRLDELRNRPVGEHAEVYADLHERLQSALVEADAEYGDRA